MKAPIYIIAILMFSVIASASVELDEIKIYVEDKVDSGADKDGGDVDVYRDDIMEVVVNLDNQFNTTANIDLMGILENIDDGDDIEKDPSNYDIDENRDRSKTLSFAIPDDARVDTYTLRVSVDWDTDNGSNGAFEIEYDIRVKEDREVEDQLMIENSLNNMTSMCGDVIQTINGCFGYINRTDECRDELSTCAEERGKFETQSITCGTTLDDMKTAKESLEEDVSDKDDVIKQKETQINNMLSKVECDNLIATNVTEAQSRGNTNLMMLGAAGAGVWLYISRKKKKGSVADSYYLEKSM